MILNGKCKEDFEEYVKNLDVAPYVVMLENIPSCYLNALIIDFFDSVGIYISIEVANSIYHFEATIFHKKYRTKTGRPITFVENNESRQQATEKAIEHANEIYNK